VGPSNSKVIISSTYGGSLDMRSAVGHLTRNIKISGTDVEGWGCTILVYYWYEESMKIDKRGYVKFDGVEVKNCG